VFWCVEIGLRDVPKTIEKFAKEVKNKTGARIRAEKREWEDKVMRKIKRFTMTNFQESTGGKERRACVGPEGNSKSVSRGRGPSIKARK